MGLECQDRMLGMQGQLFRLIRGDNQEYLWLFIDWAIPFGTMVTYIFIEESCF